MMTMNMTTTTKAALKSLQRGSGLIEVLVAVLVLSVGLLGVASL